MEILYVIHKKHYAFVVLIATNWFMMELQPAAIALRVSMKYRFQIEGIRG